MQGTGPIPNTLHRCNQVHHLGGTMLGARECPVAFSSAVRRGTQGEVLALVGNARRLGMHALALCTG